MRYKAFSISLKLSQFKGSLIGRHRQKKFDGSGFKASTIHYRVDAFFRQKKRKKKKSEAESFGDRDESVRI